jgi:peptidoglycan/xylan/chitin deacetylase (PgdA/CDA1 family)
MKRILKNVILRFADAVPNSIYRLLVPRQVISFFYHMVAEKAVPHVQHLYPFRSAQLFEQDLIYLKQNFHVISYDVLAEALRGGKRLPPKAAFLSFDDGFSECFSVARPLLLKHGLPCTFFVATDLMDNRKMDSLHQVSLCISVLNSLEREELTRTLSALSEACGVNLEHQAAFSGWIKKVKDREVVSKVCELLGVDIGNYLHTQKPYLSSEQILSMVREGFTIGAHSQSHQRLDSLSLEEIKKEIVSSCEVIRGLTNKTPVPFAFPYSARGIERGFLSSLLDRTPEVGLLFDTGGLKADRGFIVNRIWVESPKVNPAGQTSLQLILRRAYQTQLGLPEASGFR